MSKAIFCLLATTILAAPSYALKIRFDGRATLSSDPSGFGVPDDPIYVSIFLDSNRLTDNTAHRAGFVTVRQTAPNRVLARTTAGAYPFSWELEDFYLLNDVHPGRTFEQMGVRTKSIGGSLGGPLTVTCFQCVTRGFEPQTADEMLMLLFDAINSPDSDWSIPRHASLGAPTSIPNASNAIFYRDAVWTATIIPEPASLVLLSVFAPFTCRRGRREADA